MEKEIWKDIPWYEGLYQASNLWRIQSLDRYINYWWNRKWFRRWKVLKQYDRNWYLHTRLWTWKSYKVHRLILLTFKWKSELIVNHINWNKKDNRLENLEYTTYSWNLQHSYDILNRKKWWLKWKNNKKSKKVYQYNLDWTFIKVWESWNLASKWLWINQTNISKVCRWKLNKCWWYNWSFTKK